MSNNIFPLTESPWAQGGSVFFREDTKSVDQMLLDANLEWDVTLENLYTQDQKTVPMARCLVRSSDSKVLSIVGNRYSPVSNRVALEQLAIQKWIDEGKLSFITAGEWKGGRLVWFLAKLQGERMYEVVPGDAVEPLILILLGHGDRSIFIYGVSRRISCGNSIGLATQKAYFSMRIRHTNSVMDNIKYTGLMLEKMESDFGSSIDVFGRLAKKQLKAKEVDETLLSLYGSEEGTLTPLNQFKVSTIKQYWMGEGRGMDFAPKSAWNLYNSIVQHVDFEQSASKTANARSEQLLIGSLANFKHQALQKCLAFIN